MRFSLATLIDFSILTFAIMISQTVAYDFPFTINIYPISPVPGHTYPAGENITISIAITNAPFILQYGFTLNYEILGNFTDPDGGAPQEYAIASGGISAYNNITQDSVWIWNSSTFHAIPEGNSNMTFQWTYWMTTCSLVGHVDDISTLQQAESFQFFGANDGTPASPEGSTEHDIELQVVSTIYSCPIVIQPTGVPSSSLPVAEIVAPTSTQSSETSSSNKPGSTSNSLSAGSQESAVSHRQVGFNGILMVSVLAILGTLAVYFL
jgi:hypothetical protein